MPNPLAHTLSEAFVRRLKGFERSRVKVEALYVERVLSRVDAELFYEAMFLRTVTCFERLLEEVFCKLLMGSIQHKQNVTAKAEFRSMRSARPILFSGRAYADWLPYEQTAKRAKLYFVGATPFRTLDSNEKKSLERIYIIRNAVAHRSRAAQRRFQSEVVRDSPLLPAERTPAGFLRSQLSPGVTRYEDIASTCAYLGAKICGKK